MPVNKLQSLLLLEAKRIENSTNANHLTSVIQIIKTIDYQYQFNFGFEYLGAIQKLGKYEYGWGYAFSLFYKKYAGELKSKNVLKKNIIDWADSVVYLAGGIELCNQALNFEKAGLMSISLENDNSFRFTKLFENDHEKYELLSLQYNHYKKNIKFEERLQLVEKETPKVRSELIKYVKICKKNGITYDLPTRLSAFYTESAFLLVNSTFTLDDFEEDDKFGDITYKDFIDFVYYVQKIGIVHRDCCVALTNNNRTISMRKVLTQILDQRDIINQYCITTGFPIQKVMKIVDCFTLNENNIGTHLGYPKPIPAPFIKIKGDKLIVSTYGCLKNPVYFLNRELKRRYPEDFFNAVNNREIRFRNQLYEIFNQDNFIKIYENVILKAPNGKILTDIDAIVYDKKSNSLGLFQLKWQDNFTTNIKERRSRISNLIAKSIEWIDKVDGWIKTESHNNILKVLKINGEKSISKVHLFVISRNHMHFTNTELDDRAIWASWFQVEEAADTVFVVPSDDPILDFINKIEKLSPQKRPLPPDSKIVYTNNQTIELSKFKVIIG